MNSLKYPRLSNPKTATQAELIKHTIGLTEWANGAEEFIVFLQKQTLDLAREKADLVKRLEQLNLGIPGCISVLRGNAGYMSEQVSQDRSYKEAYEYMLETVYKAAELLDVLQPLSFLPPLSNSKETSDPK